MSILVGTLSGALVASGIYYAVFSRDLQTRTSRHRTDMSSLVYNLEGNHIPTPPSAASRIQHNPRKTLLKQRWNEEIEGLFVAVRDFDERVINWGRRLIGDKGSQ